MGDLIEFTSRLSKSYKLKLKAFAAINDRSLQDELNLAVAFYLKAKGQLQADKAA